MAIVDGGNSFTRTGRSQLPALPGISSPTRRRLYGAAIYPNMFLDVTGTSAISTVLLPRDAGNTTVVAEYLFPPDVIAADGFDPTEIVDFTELVATPGLRRLRAGAAGRALARVHPRRAGREGRAAGQLQRPLPGPARRGRLRLRWAVLQSPP